MTHHMLSLCQQEKKKVVKIVLEGELQMNDWTNKDWSLEMQKNYGGMLYYNKGYLQKIHQFLTTY